MVVPKSVSDIGSHAFGFTLEYPDENSDEGEYSKLSGFKMSVSSGSAAKKYAKKSGLKYTVSDGNLLKFVFIVVCIALIAAAVVFGLVLMSRSRKLPKKDIRKAIKKEKAKAEEASYKKIVDDDEQESSGDKKDKK